MKDSEWLKAYLQNNEIKARVVETGKVSTVDEAAREMNCDKRQVIKSLVLVTESGRAVVVVVDGKASVDIKRIRRLLGENVRMAEREEIVHYTGFSAGGVPPVGHECEIIIDRRVLENEIVYGGGGDKYHLIEINPKEILRMGARVEKVRK
ncbi:MULTISPECIES: aminoacyl-tRNA deacylase [unclassified Archaeoglobus]|jgi:prolyl-tRNA editing enzyme YbaK/EbsC (Cys-tRNA(Pro) deacylase)|uniref:aminoacyl-tRNA deacylase n=1 Tax=unclassified Archaeoglobus TaxID=2643606 RepID=UPI0025B7BB5E|nr:MULTISPECIES: YbaK/EbsC family protein [unclassified Archaeoglobus]